MFQVAAQLDRFARALAAGDTHLRLPPQFGQAANVVAAERLLQPVDVQFGQRVGHAPRLLQVPRRARVPGHAPGLVGVAQQRQRGRGVAHGANGGDVILRVFGEEAQLDGGKPLGLQAPHGGHARLAVEALAGGGVEGHATAAAAQQAPQRLTGDLADQVPQGDLQRPHAAVVELEVVEDGNVALDLQRTAAEEQPLVAGET